MNGTDERTSAVLYATGSAVLGGLGVVSNSIFICFLLKGVTKLKPFECILLATAMADDANAFIYICQTYPILSYDATFCKYCGLLAMTFNSTSMMMLPINMLHRYLSLYHTEFCKSLSLVKCAIFCAISFFIHIFGYIMLEFYDVFGRDDTGSCTIWIDEDSNPLWLIVICVELFSYGLLSMFLALMVAKKIRAHTTQVDSSFQSPFIVQSKQIVVLVLILASLPMFNVSIGIFARSYIPKTIMDLCIDRALQFIGLAPTPAMPIITIYVIKEYRKTFKTFLFHRKNQVVPT